MTESEFLERIDAHIAQTGEHIAETRDHIAVANRHMERGNDLFERLLVLHDDTRGFIHEMTLRNERFTRDLIREVRSGREEVLAQTDVLRDLHREMTAQRDSIWRVHDTLEQLGPEDESSND